MTMKPEILDAMLKAGCTAEQIVAVVKASIIGEQEMADLRRSRDAERKRSSRNVRDVTRIPADSSDIADKEEKEKSLTKKEKEEPQSSKEKTPKGVKKKGSFPRPDDVTEETWADFVRQREKSRAPITETALEGIRREAGAVNWTLEQALRECCLRGWRGFKGEWVKDQVPQSTVEAVPVDKSGWQEWHVALERHLPANVIAAWIIPAQRDGPVLICPSADSRDRCLSHYANQLGRVGIKEIIFRESA